MLTDPDLLIIGAGPAGLAAANAAAAGGLRVLIVDENKRVGGQITRLPFQGPPHPMESLHANVIFSGMTQFLGHLDGGRVALNVAGAGAVLRPRAVLTATGGVERVYPVPGWTKLGVMTAGAGQTFLKGSGSLPYRRVVVAGTGPLLLAAASQLIDANIEVAAVVEAAAPGPRQMPSLLRILAGGSIMLEGAGYIANLAAARVPVLLGSAVIEVLGDSSATGVRIARVDRQWRRRQGRERTIDCEAVLFSQGFGSAVDVAAQAGAALRWNDAMQTWAPLRDASLKTTRAGLWAAGDCAGIGGSKIAALEGRLAGLSIVTALTGAAPEPSEQAKLRRTLRRLTTFRRGMDEVFRVGDGVHELAADDTVVCRCQETTAGEIRRAIDDGAATLHAVKLWSRAGMGICQGRTCSPLVDVMASGSRTDDAFELRDPPRPKFPIRPTSTRVLQALSESADTTHTTQEKQQ